MRIDYHLGRIGERCPRCGGLIRVCSAKRLLGGKAEARVMVECGCHSGTYRLTKAERQALLPTRH